MLKGIETSAAFVLFLSTGVLERPYCQMEIRHALALKKPLVLLHGECERVRARRARMRTHAQHGLMMPARLVCPSALVRSARPLSSALVRFAQSPTRATAATTSSRRTPPRRPTSSSCSILTSRCPSGGEATSATGC